MVLPFGKIPGGGKGNKTRKLEKTKFLSFFHLLYRRCVFVKKTTVFAIDTIIPILKLFVKGILFFNFLFKFMAREVFVNT